MIEMDEPAPIAIDPSRKFEHLSNAPIVEAVIELRARAETAWTESEIADKLKRKLPKYTTAKTIRGFSLTLNITEEPAAPPSLPPPEQHEWLGLRLETEDPRNIAKFTRDTFSFSRLKPYADWDQFSEEALRLWEIHKDLAMPSEIQRIGVRFINRLEVPATNLALGEYFQGLESHPSKLQTSGFLYRDRFHVPPYDANVIRTSQPPGTESPVKLGLLLDVDVFCSEPFAPKSGMIQSKLADMRSLKNGIFFDSLTEKALDLCR